MRAQQQRLVAVREEAARWAAARRARQLKRSNSPKFKLVHVTHKPPPKLTEHSYNQTPATPVVLERASAFFGVTHRGPPARLKRQMTVAAMTGLDSLKAALLRENERVMDFFRKLDVNKDGRVSASEFRSILPLFGPDPTFTEDDLDVLFQSIDDDGSGSIGYQELNAVLRQGLQTKLDEDLKAGAVEFEMESKLLRHDLRTSSNKRLIIHGGGVGSGGESADGGNGPSFSTGPSAKPTVLLLVECSPNAESASCRHSLDKYAAYFGLLKAAFDGKVIPSNDTEDTERSMTVKVQQTPETLAPVWSDEAEWWPGGSFVGADNHNPSYAWPPPRSNLPQPDQHVWSRGQWFGEQRPVNVSFAAARPARVGAFEIYLVTKQHGDPKVWKIFSKLEQRCWPKVKNIVQRCNKIFKTCHADWALGDLMQQKNELEASLLETKLELWKSMATMPVRDAARAMLACIRAADRQTEEAMPNPAALRVLLDGPPIGMSPSLRAVAIEKRAKYDEATEAADLEMNAALVAPEQEELRTKLERLRADLSVSMSEGVHKVLAELEANDARMRNAMVNPDALRLILEEDILVSASVRAAAEELRAKNDDLTKAADATLMAIVLTGGNPEEADLVAAMQAHKEWGSSYVQNQGETKLNDLRLANRSVKAAMAKSPQEATELTAAIKKDAHRLSVSVKEAALALLDSLRAADNALREAMTKLPQVASEIEGALKQYGQQSSRSVAEEAFHAAADAGLSEAMATVPLEAKELREALTRHGQNATAPVRAEAEQKLERLQAADTALRMAMTGPKVEAEDLESAYAQFESQASVSVRSDAEAKLATLRAADAAIAAASASMPPEASVLQEAFTQHNAFASAKVAERAGARLEEMHTADSALRAALVQTPLEFVGLVATRVQHDLHASASVKVQVEEKMASMRVADAALIADAATVPQEAALLRESLTRHKLYASVSVATGVEEQLAILQAADSALSALLTASPLEASALKDALSQHGKLASHTSRFEAEQKLSGLQKADEALTAAAAKLPLELDDLRDALVQHGPYASFSLRDSLERRLDMPISAGSALRAALVKTPLNADELASALSEHARHASASIKGEVDQKLASLREADAALTAALAKIPLEIEPLREAMTHWGPYASGVVADQVTATLDEGGKAGAALRAALAKTALNADELAAELDAHAPHSSASLKAEVEEKLASLRKADAALTEAIATEPLVYEDLKAALTKWTPYASTRVLEQAASALTDTADSPLKAAMTAQRVEFAELNEALNHNEPYASVGVAKDARRKAESLRAADEALYAAIYKVPLEADDLKEVLDQHTANASSSVREEAQRRLTSLDEADEMLRTVMSKDKVTRDELRTVLRSHGIKASAGLRGEAEKLARVNLVTEPVRPGRDWSQPRTPQKPPRVENAGLSRVFSRESLLVEREPDI